VIFGITSSTSFAVIFLAAKMLFQISFSVLIVSTRESGEDSFAYGTLLPIKI
jgi:hypothetical protein